MSLLLKYLQLRFFTVLFFGYIGLSILLKAFLNIDCTLPCLIKLFTGYQCLGCGLTTAFVSLVKGDVHTALEANFLIVIVLPAFLLLIIKDMWHFLKKHKSGLAH